MHQYTDLIGICELLCKAIVVSISTICDVLPRPRSELRCIVFTRSVCRSMCVSVCVSGQYFGILFIRRDIGLKCIQNTNRVVLNSHKHIDLHRSKVKVTGTVHCFF